RPRRIHRTTTANTSAHRAACHQCTLRVRPVRTAATEPAGAQDSTPATEAARTPDARYPGPSFPQQAGAADWRHHSRASVAGWLVGPGAARTTVPPLPPRYTGCADAGHLPVHRLRRCGTVFRMAGAAHLATG